MAVSINWAIKRIYVPKADLTFVSGTLYELSTNWFRLQLRDLEDSDEGIVNLRTHKHNTEVTILGTTFARTIEIINGYSVEFEDGSYTVKLVGSNNNIFDSESGVLVRNSVQVVSTNSAGLIQSASDKQITEDINYANGVYLDVSSSTTGAVYPAGTRTFPVNNLTDAIAIGVIRSQSTIQLAGTLTLDQDVSGLEFIGWKNGKIDMNGQPCLATRFRELKLYGNQGGLGLFFDCRISNLQNLLGVYNDCRFLGTDTILLSSGDTELFDCETQTAGGEQIFDFTNGGTLNTKNFTGKVSFQNNANPASVNTISVGVASVTLDSNMTAGMFMFSGIGYLTDNSGDGCTVVNGFVQGGETEGSLTPAQNTKLMGLENPVLVDGGVILY